MFEECQASHKHVNGVLTKMSLSPVVGTCLVRTAPQAIGLQKNKLRVQNVCFHIIFFRIPIDASHIAK